MPLNREQLKSAKGRLKQEVVPVPEWAPEGKSPEESTVIVRAIKASESVEVVELTKQGYSEAVVMFHFCVINEETGEPLMSLEESQELFECSAFAPFGRCIQKAKELSGIGEAQAIEKK